MYHLCSVIPRQNSYKGFYASLEARILDGRVWRRRRREQQPASVLITGKDQAWLQKCQCVWLQRPSSGSGNGGHFLISEMIEALKGTIKVGPSFHVEATRSTCHESGSLPGPGEARTETAVSESAHRPANVYQPRFIKNVARQMGGWVPAWRWSRGSFRPLYTAELVRRPDHSSPSTLCGVLCRV